MAITIEVACKVLLSIAIQIKIPATFAIETLEQSHECQMVECALSDDVAGVEHVGCPEVGAGVDSAVVVLIPGTIGERRFFKRKETLGGKDRRGKLLFLLRNAEAMRWALDTDCCEPVLGEV